MASFIRMSENGTRLAVLCVVALTLGVASAAQARTETLRWSQATPPEVSGFRVYVGSASHTYTEVIEAGLPAADALGIRSYDLPVADDATVYVAVSAYNALGEGPLSDEQIREPEPPATTPTPAPPTPTPAPPTPTPAPPTPTPTPSEPPPPGEAGGDVLFSGGFETSATGQYVPGWVDTQAGNSMLEDDSLFEVADLGGNRVFGTSSTLTNIHSHYVSSGSAGWSAYEFRGRMLITDSNSGIGITVHSKYPNTDAYYRIMRWGGGGGDFSMEPHPYPTPVECESSRTGIVPQANRWYRFRFEVLPNQTSTSVRAKVWQDGTPEPTTWQVRCEDRLSDRLDSGTIGVWSMSAGSKYWDDLEVIALSGGTTPGGPIEPAGRPGRPRIVLPTP